MFSGYPLSRVTIEINFWCLGLNQILILLVLDRVRAMFLGTVLLITLAVLLFRARYIKLSNLNTSFHFTLLYFVASIVILIISPNIISLLVG